MKRSSRRSPADDRGRLSAWDLTYRGFDPALENLREALCTLGNGYMGIRGAIPESPASRAHYPGTYLAGVYNTLATQKAGKTIYSEDMVNCPNCLLISFRANKAVWNEDEQVEMLSYRQRLDIRRGVLTRSKRVRDAEGQVTQVDETRIVSMASPHLMAIRYVIRPLNYAGEITIQSYLDGSVENTGVPRYRELRSKHLRAVSQGARGRAVTYLTTETSSSKVRISEAARFAVRRGSAWWRGRMRVLRGKERIGCEARIPVGKGQTIAVEKTCAIYTSRDRARPSPQAAAIAAVTRSPVFGELLRAHEAAWRRLWDVCDMRVTGDSFADAVIRFHTFHLLQAASPHNTQLDAGLAARGLSGESYRGHIFWDELFVMPFMSTHVPATAEALLRYRFRRLEAARAYARKNGYEGSMFPWQSGSTGKEETQEIHLNPLSGKWGPDLSRNQRHVSFAIAYTTWRHWVITRDRSFLRKYGAEMILSIAQFGSSLCRYDGVDGRYHTEGLMGPDEFHERLPLSTKAGFRDNAYSNVLIVWTLLRAQEVLKELPAADRRRLVRKLGITDTELERWSDISSSMNIPMNTDGIISQFEGYFRLKELDWNAYRERHKNIQRLDRILKSEGKSPDDYKVSKQADVLMIFYLLPFEEVEELFARLGYTFSRALLRKNYEYYVARTSHGSTLSKVVHCYIAHLLGMDAEALDWYREVLRSDICDTQGGTTPEGIHAGVMGGSIDIAVKAFAGVDIERDRVNIDPSLPPHWKSISLTFLVRGMTVRMAVKRRHVTIAVSGPRTRGTDLTFSVEGRAIRLSPGRRIQVPVSGGRARGGF